jgi:hypothetical protein
MPKYIFSINSNVDSELSSSKSSTGLATYEIEAKSPEAARGDGFTRFCKENPDLSQDTKDYTTDVGCQKS